MGMRRLGDSTEILHNFGRSPRHQSLTSRLRGFCRRIQGNVQRFEGLRQKSADLFER